MFFLKKGTRKLSFSLGRTHAYSHHSGIAHYISGRPLEELS